MPPFDDIRFYRDPDTGLAHCDAQHGVHEREALDVLRHPAWRFRRSDGTFVAEGQTGGAAIFA